MYTKGKKLLITFVFIISVISIVKTIPLFFEIMETDEIFKAVSSIESEKDYFTFAVMGDNKNSISTFNKIINSINTDKTIDFTINTGDMVFDGNPVKYNFFLKQYRQFVNPMLPVPGNHDMEDGGRDRYADIFGPLYYSYSRGKSFFIVLDDSNQENLDLWQMKWLEEKLIESAAYDHLFVFMHVPLYDPRKGKAGQPGHSLENPDSVKKILDLLKPYPVDMVFAGHIHGYFKGDWEGLPYTITGGGGAEMIYSVRENYFYHYIKVTVNGEDVSYNTVRIDSPDFNIIDRIGSFLWIYIYSFIVINYWVLIMFITIGFLFFVYLKRYGKKFPLAIIWKKKG